MCCLREAPGSCSNDQKGPRAPGETSVTARITCEVTRVGVGWGGSGAVSPVRHQLVAGALGSSSLVHRQRFMSTMLASKRELCPHLSSASMGSRRGSRRWVFLVFRDREHICLLSWSRSTLGTLLAVGAVQGAGVQRFDQERAWACPGFATELPGSLHK